MSSYLQKLGEGATTALTYLHPIASKIQSFYDGVTDKVVLPTIYGAYNAWNKYKPPSADLPPLDPEKMTEKLPKRPRRCARGVDCFARPFIYISGQTKKLLDPQFLYTVCKYVKEYSYRQAQTKPVKIPNLESYNRFGQAAGRICEKTDEVAIQGFRCLYVVAEVGEQTCAFRLFVAEMAPQLRPSLNEHVIQPVFADLNTAIAGPETAPALSLEYAVSLVRSEAGAVVEEKGPALVNNYLEEKEKQITQKLQRMEEDAQTQAISWLSQGALRQVVSSVVTPALIWGTLSLSGRVIGIVSLGTSAENSIFYLGTVTTAAYALSFLKYLNILSWATKTGKTIYDLHQSYTPEFTDKIKETLRRSLSTHKTDFDPTQETRNYRLVISETFTLSELIDKLPIAPLIEKGKKSNVAGYLKNFTYDIKTKSLDTLSKYDLISPQFEEVFDDYFVDCPEFEDPAPKAPALPPPPKASTSPSEALLEAGLAFVMEKISPSAPTGAHPASDPESVAPSPSAPPKSDSPGAVLVGAVVDVLLEKASPSPSAPKDKSLEEKDPDSVAPSPSALPKSDSPADAFVKAGMELVAAKVFPATAPKDAPPLPKEGEPVAPSPSAPPKSDSPEAAFLKAGMELVAAKVFSKDTPPSTGTTPVVPSPSAPPKSDPRELKDRVSSPTTTATSDSSKSETSKPNWVKRAAVVALVGGIALLGFAVLRKMAPSLLSRASLNQILQDRRFVELFSNGIKALVGYLKNLSINRGDSSSV